MKTQTRILSIILFFVFFASIGNAQKKVYNSVAGVSKVYESVTDDETGTTKTVVTEEAFGENEKTKKDRRAFSRFLFDKDVKGGESE